MYAKMKEFGPIGGACTRHAPPRSANAMVSIANAVRAKLSGVACIPLIHAEAAAPLLVVDVGCVGGGLEERITYCIAPTLDHSSCWKSSGRSRISCWGRKPR